MIQGEILQQVVIGLFSITIMVYMIILSAIMWGRQMYASYMSVIVVTFLIALWSGLVLIQFLHPTIYNENLQRFIAVLFFAGLPIIAFLFPNQEFRWRYLWTTVPGIICAGIALIPGAAATTVYFEGYGYVVAAGGWYDLILICVYYGYVYFSIAILAYRVFHEERGDIRHYISLLLLGYFFFGNVGGVTNVLIPYFGWYALVPVGILMGLGFSTTLLVLMPARSVSSDQM